MRAGEGPGQKERMKVQRWVFRALIGLASITVSATTPSISHLSTPHPPINSAVRIRGVNYTAGAVSYGPVGTPVVISGTNFGSSGTVTFRSVQGGWVNASIHSWSDTSILAWVPSAAVTGDVIVVAGDQFSNSVPFVVTSPGGTYRASCPQVVDSASVILNATPNPVLYGATVTFTATITPGASGTVTFKDGNAVLGTVAVNNGTAILTTRSLTTGLHSITAFYGGDGSYQPATSSTLTQTVNDEDTEPCEL